MRKKGFTLTELLAVLVILSIIVLLAAPNIVKFLKESKKESFISEVETMVSSANYMHKSEHKNGYVLNDMKNVPDKDPFGYVYKESCISYSKSDSGIKDLKEDKAQVYVKTCDDKGKCHYICNVDADKLSADSIQDSPCSKIPADCGGYDETEGIDPPTCSNKTYNGIEQTLVDDRYGITWSNNNQKNAGEYTITAKLNDGNHWSDGTTADKKITCSISKKNVTLRVDGKTMTQGGSAPIYSYKVDGAVAGDVAVSGTPNYTIKQGDTVINNVSAAGLGEYKIVLSGLTATNNYAITGNTPGTLKIESAKVATVGSCSNLTYNGNNQTLASGAQNATYINNSGKNAGTYSVIIKANDDYAFSDGDIKKTLTCSIGKKKVTVKADDKTMTYGGSVPTYSYKVDGEVLGDVAVSGTASYVVKNSSGSTVTVNGSTTPGTYKITPSGLTAGSNYTIEYKDGTLTVNKGVCAAPTNVAVGTDGKVTWTASSNASSYQISMDNSNWETATSGINYLNKITSSTGSRTVYVRSVCNSTNYNTPSANATKAVNVYTLTTSSNNTNYGTLDSSTYNVISGVTYTTSTNKLLVKSGSTTLKTITATPKENYLFDKWSSTSGTISTNTSVTATFILSELDTSGANAPEISGNMIPVYYDESAKVWKKADVTNKNPTYKWYDYNSKMWANSVTVSAANRETYKNAALGTTIPMDDILTMQVWIPRYKYDYLSLGSEPKQVDITFENGTATTGEIKCVDSLSGDTNTPSEICSYNGNDCSRVSCKDKKYTHPAFTFGNEELSGIWVGKFEVSNSTSQIEVKPDVQSLRNQTVKAFSDAMLNMNNSGNSYGFTEREDTHMMKNSEWGAVAFLSHSKYGTCSDGTCDYVYRNDSSGYYTGRASSTGQKYGFSTNGAFTYNDIGKGTKASTTQNIYGIYDMSGGSDEYVMGNIVDSDPRYMHSGSSGFTLNPYPEDKYYNKYSYNSSYDNWRNNKKGDATEETWVGYQVTICSGVSRYVHWYKEAAYSPTDTDPWVTRGGNYIHQYDDENTNYMYSCYQGHAGLFSSGSSDGSAKSYISSRLVISLSNSLRVNVTVNNGTIEGDTSKDVSEGSHATFTVKPSSGYTKGTVSCTNGQTATLSGNTLTTGDITQSTTCTVTYQQVWAENLSYDNSETGVDCDDAQCMIDYIAGMIDDNSDSYKVDVVVKNGTVEPSSKNVKQDKDAVFSLTPTVSEAEGSVTCTNNQIGSITNNVLTVSKVSSDTTCTVTFESNLDKSTANKPEISGNMIPVYYDESDSVWKKADINNRKETYKWYDYNNKMWANSVTVSAANRETYKNAALGTTIPMNDILTMQVWIPRYKYKVWNYNADGTKTSIPQAIDITYEKGIETTGEIKCEDHISKTDGAKSETCLYNGNTCTDETCNGKTYTHPAFTFGNDELPGFWIGKFEVSGTTNQIEVKPNVSSLRAVTNYTIFNNFKNMNSSGNVYGFDVADDTHMIKNVEWGAVAYLSHSNYGTCNDETCTEVAPNNNNSHFTGKTTGGNYVCTTGVTSYDDFSKGINASTTRNIYGVYDMSGGYPESVMAFYRSNATAISYYPTGDNITGLVDSKYYDKYSYNTSTTNLKTSKLGDAIREVRRYTSTDGKAWYDDMNKVISGYNKWFSRGGDACSSNNSHGIFASESTSDYTSSRLVISKLEKYVVNVVVNGGTVDTSNKVVVSGANAMFNLTSSYSTTSSMVSCTNGQKGNVDSDNVLTIRNVTSDTTCTVTNSDAGSTVLYNDGTLIINEKSEDRNTNITKHGTVTKTYEPFSNSNAYIFESNTSQLWNSEKSSIKSVEIGQKIKPTSTKYWFYYVYNMANGDFTNLDTSDVTNMQGMFTRAGQDTSSFSLKGLADWDTSSVTNMEDLFAYSGRYATTWNIGDLSSWNTSNVENMAWTLQGTGYSANTFDISFAENWDTSKVTNMQGMYQDVGFNSNTFTIGDLSTWDTSKVTNMQKMFYQFGKNSESVVDIGTLNIRATDVTEMFKDSTKIKAVLNVFSKPSSYTNVFNAAATDTNSLITVNYYCTNDTVVDSMIATKSSGSHIVKGINTCNIEKTVTLEVEHGSSDVSSKTVILNFSAKFNVTPSSGYEGGKVTCTNNQTASIKNNVVTTDKITSDTTCTVSFCRSSCRQETSSSAGWSSANPNQVYCCGSVSTYTSEHKYQITGTYVKGDRSGNCDSGSTGASPGGSCNIKTQSYYSCTEDGTFSTGDISYQCKLHQFKCECNYD